MSRLRLVPLACAIALSLPASLAFAADAVAVPKGVTPASCVEGICEYRLANGLQVLLFPDASKPTVTVNVTYHVGSVKESYGETGMAHLLEHLVFKGTPTHADIPGEMKKRGVTFNGTTNLDRTNYFGSFPANDATLDWMLSMEADRMVNSFIAKKDLDSEMTVVRNEMERNENEPGSVFNQRMRSTAYQWHNYGKSTIGNRADVENVPITNLQAFYRQWYQPDNATLIIAGRFDPAKVLAKVQATFGKLKRPARTLPTLWTVEPTQDVERDHIARPFPDRVERRLAEQARHRAGFDISGAAMRLHRFIDEARRPLADPIFGDRCQQPGDTGHGGDHGRAAPCAGCSWGWRR